MAFIFPATSTLSINITCLPVGPTLTSSVHVTSTTLSGNTTASPAGQASLFGTRLVDDTHTRFA
ncbi:hypothetical protein WAI453_008255 [Rhynchosporium graminicola]